MPRRTWSCGRAGPMLASFRKWPPTRRPWRAHPGPPNRMGRRVPCPTRSMLRGCHLHRRPERSANFGDLFALRGDDSVIQDTHAFHSAPNPFDEGPTEKRIEGFVGEAGRRQPCRDDAQNVTAHRPKPGHEAIPVAANITPVKLSGEEHGWQRLAPGEDNLFLYRTKKLPKRVLPCSEKSDSGWNCTPQTGRSRCRIA